MTKAMKNSWTAIIRSTVLSMLQKKYSDYMRDKNLESKTRIFVEDNQKYVWAWTGRTKMIIFVSRLINLEDGELREQYRLSATLLWDWF